MGKGTRAAAATPVPVNAVSADDQAFRQIEAAISQAEAEQAVALAAWTAADAQRRRAQSTLGADERELKKLQVIAASALDARQVARLTLLQSRVVVKEAALSEILEQVQQATREHTRCSTAAHEARRAQHQLRMRIERTSGNSVYGAARNGYISLAALCADLPADIANMPLARLRLANRGRHRVWIAPRSVWATRTDADPLFGTLGWLADEWSNGSLDTLTIRKDEPSQRYRGRRDTDLDRIMVEVDDAGLPKEGVLEVGTSPYLAQVLAMMDPDLKQRLSIGQLYGWPRLLHWSYEVIRRAAAAGKVETNARAISIAEVEKRLPEYDKTGGPHFDHATVRVNAVGNAAYGPTLDSRLRAPIVSLDPDL